jgi:hypothetical protein
VLKIGGAAISITACSHFTCGDNWSVDDKNEKHSSVGKTHEIDQRAEKIFLNWLPDAWLARKQAPDFFVDYLVEIVETGEPTGKHFGVQIKGYEELTETRKPLSYSFKTKHLDYYLNRSLHPIFLLLINVSTREGYWLFAQKYLKEKVDQAILAKQKTLLVQFAPDDNLFNDLKFKCLLPPAEQFVRDLHPGSPLAAIQKRKAELEAKDPRCSVSVSIKDGSEHVIVTANENFQFKTNINSANPQGWKDLFERGKKLKIKRGEIEFVGAPIMEEVVKAAGSELEIRYGTDYPGALHIISKAEQGKIIPIEGRFRGGTKYLTFDGQFPNSPLGISFEVSLDAARNGEEFNLAISFQPKKWTGQPILFLPYYDQITAFCNAFRSETSPEMEIFVQGNSVVRGTIDGDTADIFRGISKAMEWFGMSRWLAQHYQINPLVPAVDHFSIEQVNALVDLYDLLTQSGKPIQSPLVRIEFFSKEAVTENAIATSDRVLRIEKSDQMFDLFGTPVHLGPIRHEFTEMNFISQSQCNDGNMKIVLRGTQNTVRTSTLL